MYLQLLIILTVGSTILAELAADVKIMEKCLGELSSPKRLESDLEKLAHYAEWTEEQVPCLMRCLASEKGWFDIQSNSWHKQRLVDELSADVYNYCRHELQRRQRNGCLYAYRGMRCLKQAEQHAGQSYTTLLQCARQLNASYVELLQYSKLKAKENIPCLFQCFADAMQFYDAEGNWQLQNWHKAFGPTRQETYDFGGCRSSSAEQRKQPEQRCAWMYEEYRCWERINGNLVLDETTTMLATTTETETSNTIKN